MCLNFFSCSSRICSRGSVSRIGFQYGDSFNFRYPFEVCIYNFHLLPFEKQVTKLRICQRWKQSIYLNRKKERSDSVICHLSIFIRHSTCSLIRHSFRRRRIIRHSTHSSNDIRHSKRSSIVIRHLSFGRPATHKPSSPCCPMPSALCSMPSALCPLPSFVFTVSYQL